LVGSAARLLSECGSTIVSALLPLSVAVAVAVNGVVGVGVGAGVGLDCVFIPRPLWAVGVVGVEAQTLGSESMRNPLSRQSGPDNSKNKLL